MKRALLTTAAATAISLLPILAEAESHGPSKTCLWNGKKIPCKVQNTVNGMGWIVRFNNGAENAYWLPDQTVNLTTPAGSISTARVQEASNIFDDERKAWIMRAIDQNGNVLEIVH